MCRSSKPTARPHPQWLSTRSICLPANVIPLSSRLTSPLPTTGSMLPTLVETQPGIWIVRTTFSPLINEVDQVLSEHRKRHSFACYPSLPRCCRRGSKLPDVSWTGWRRVERSCWSKPPCTWYLSYCYALCTVVLNNQIQPLVASPAPEADINITLNLVVVSAFENLTLKFKLMTTYRLLEKLNGTSTTSATFPPTFRPSSKSSTVPTAQKISMSLKTPLCFPLTKLYKSSSLLVLTMRHIVSLSLDVFVP